MLKNKLLQEKLHTNTVHRTAREFLANAVVIQSQKAKSRALGHRRSLSSNVLLIPSAIRAALAEAKNS